MSNTYEVAVVPRTERTGILRSPVSTLPETFHAIVDDRRQQYIVYHPATMTFFESSRVAAEAVRAWEHARIQGWALPVEQEKLAQRTLQALENIVIRKSPAAEDEEEINTRRLRRLAINVTQVCNLHCPMCYATDEQVGSGSYGSDVRYVIPSVAERAFKLLLEYYPDGIELIQFHGGEPLLHPRGIAHACERINAYCADKNIQPPVYTVITNGTCMTEEVLDLIERYAIRVTVSLDGTRELNDESRPWAPGRSTYDAVVNGLTKLKERHLDPFSIECTISKLHLGTDLVTLADHFKSLGAANMHIAPAAINQGHPHWLNPIEQEQMLEQWRDLFDAVMDRMGTPDPLYLRSVLGRIEILRKRHREKHLCPAGTNTIAVDVTGNISACFMFTGMHEFQMGRVQGRPQHNQFRERQAHLLQTLLAHPALCTTCWADGVCGDCSASQFITGMREETTYPYNCRYDRLLIERVLLGLARLQRNPETWAQLKTKLGAIPKDIKD
jgi:uncharacterized protein